MASSIASLWGEEFNIPSTQEVAKKVIKKIKEVDPEKLLKAKNTTLEEKLKIINENVLKILGHYKENTQVIKTREELHSYIDASISNGIIAIDTETNNSLDALTCKLMGGCIYTPGQKNAYIPINHIDRLTGERLDWQLTEKDIKEEFDRLQSPKANVKILTHNGKFDYKVLHCTCGFDMNIYWDSYVAARLLDENEPSAGLKQQYINKINPSQEKYSIDHLFESVEYAVVDPDIFALYAATDSFMTYELYLWQVERFKDPDLSKIYNLMMNTEIPLIPVVAKMEMRGITLDKNYASRLSKKVHLQVEDCTKRVEEEISKYDEKIAKWRLTEEANKRVPNKKGDGFAKSKNEQLETPVKYSSPTQLAILLYDILKCPQVSAKQPRGTGVEELKSLYDKTQLPLCKLILESRGLEKLLNTFVDKLPNDINPNDGKIHCEFGSLATDTGRFNSSRPNLQQLPRDDKSIKMMLRAQKGYKLVGSDYSGQEMRMSAHASNDPDMIKAYTEGKDLYSVVATAMYNNTYEENLEFYPVGTEIIYEGEKITVDKPKTYLNKQGKLRRQSAKAVLIGSVYGRGAQSIATQINEKRGPDDKLTKEDAQEIMDKFYSGFPRIKKWMDECHELAHKQGYVENWNGRRRRLPDAMLPRYTIIDKEDGEFNPLLGCSNRVNNEKINKYKKILEEVKWKKEYDRVKLEALKEGVEIHDNQGYIAQAERQSVNFPCQSGGAELTKLAMISIDKDAKLNKLGFGLLLTIHDEVLGECPEENAEEAAQRLTEIMINTAKENNIKVPMSCDPAISTYWLEDEMVGVLNDEYNKYSEKLGSTEKGLEKVISLHGELTPEAITNTLLHGAELKVS